MCENPNEMYAYREQLKYQLFIGMEMMNYEWNSTIRQER
jgi:hypothetical protein